MVKNSSGYRNGHKNGYKTSRRTKKRIVLPKVAAVLFIFVAALIVPIIFSNKPVKTRAAQGAQVEKHYRSIPVSYGDTLWDIACKYMDNDEYVDAGEYIDEVKSINNLAGDRITTGQNLIVPYFVSDKTTLK